MIIFFRAFAAALATLSAAAFSAGFQISETSTTAMGRGFAGVGISGDGASDMFHNPAGLMLREGSEWEIALYAIEPNADYEDEGSTLTVGEIGSESNGGERAVVPNIYYAGDIEENARFGIGLTSPFGLTTNYDPDWIGRYHAIRSELITVELNPAVAVRVSDRVSLGIGATIVSAKAELSQALLTGTATVEGEDTGLGFTAGVMVGDEQRRFGVGYRSKVAILLEGSARIPFPLPIGIQYPAAQAKITLPASLYLSGFTRLDEKWDLLGSVRWTDWSEFHELRVTYDNDDLPPSVVLEDSVTPEQWDDAITYSVGVNYHVNPKWTVRFGYARDESPIGDDDLRTPAIPDTDRDWLTTGFSYRHSPKLRWDFSYAHLFTDNAAVHPEALDLNPIQPGSVTHQLDGNYTNTAADIFSLQLHIDL